MSDDRNEERTIDLERQGRFLQRLSRELTRDPWAGDDALQSTALWTLMRQHDESVRTIGWWRRVLGRAFVRERRAKERRARHEDEAAARIPAAAAAASDVAARRETLHSLTTALIELDPAALDVVWRRYFEGLAPRQIAKLRGETTVAVKSRLRRALERLRDRLDRSTDGDRSRWFSVLSPLGISTHLATTSGVLLMALTTKILLASAAAALLFWAFLNRDDAENLRKIETSPVGEVAAVAARRDVDQATADTTPVISAPSENRPIESGRHLSGRVVDQSGRPVVGASITAEPWDPTVGQRAIDPERPNPLLRTARSNVEGRFIIRSLPKAPAFELCAMVEGGGMSVAEQIAPNREDILLVVGGTWELSGRIMDLDVRAIPHATVDFEMRWKSRLIRRQARADEDGCYRFESLPSMPGYDEATAGETTLTFTSQFGVSAAFLVQAKRNGFATQAVVVSGHRSLQSDGRVDDVDFYLAREKRVCGVISDAASGAPIAGADVVLWSIDKRGFGSGRRAIAKTRSDASGRYEVGGVPVRMEHISLSNVISTPGGAAASFMEVQSPIYATSLCPIVAGTAGGEVETLDVSLVPAFEISGRIVGADGKGLGGVDVVSWPSASGSVGSAVVALIPSLRVTTGADGRYSFSSPVTAGEREALLRVGVIESFADRLLPFVDVAIPAKSPIVLDDLVVADLSGVARWTSRIVSIEGPPIPGAKVSVGLNTVLTDEEGRFEIQAPRFDENGKSRSFAGFKIQARGFKSISGTLTKELADRPPPTVRMEPLKGSFVGGRVLDANGRPVADARVQLLDGALPIEQADRFDPQRPWLRRGSCAPFATTDFMGRFEFAGVEVPIVHLVVRHPDDRNRAELPPDALLASIPCDGQDHVLSLPFAEQSTWTRIYVHVRSALDGGLLREGVGAGLSRDGTYLEGATACGPGLVCLDDVAPGRYEIVGYAKEHMRGDPVVIDVAGEKRIDVEVTLERGGVIRGTAYGRDGRPLGDRIQVRARRDNGDGYDTHTIATDSSGQFRFSGLEWGRWAVEGTPHAAIQLASLSILEARLSSASPSAELNLVMVEGAALTVKLRTRELREQGAASFGSTTPQMNQRARDLARKHTIRIERSDGTLVFEGCPDAGGVLDRQSPALQKSLPSGTYCVIVREGIRELHRADVQVPATIEVDIE